MHFNPGINTKKWQLILIPLIALIVSLLITYNSNSEAGRFFFPWRLFITLCIFTFFTWQANLISYRVLDKRMAFYENPGKRLLVQIISCSMATWISFVLLYFITLFTQGGGLKDFSQSNFFFFLLVATGISFIINSLYFIRYLQSTVLYKEAISTEKLNRLLEALEQQNNNLVEEKAVEPAQRTHRPKSMIIETGSKTISIPFSEMAYWFSSDGIVILVLNDGRKVTTNFNSFTPIADKLPTDNFFQLSRQFITHLQSIVSITDDSNRKLIVELAAVKSTGKRENVTVSRYRSQELKQWFAKRL
ncbi:MAG: LytTR family transcriptional regulator DNA-binding domain-containing protein [Rhizobacter sp.]|nr:LytTR family transcriptional regulator DNA-binding domain-containing protein [Ferruginibacter sp.]